MYAELGSHHNIRILKRINEELVDDRKEKEDIILSWFQFWSEFSYKEAMENLSINNFDNR